MMAPGPPPICLLVHLAGRFRGMAVEVAGEEIRIGSAPGMEIRLPVDTDPSPAPHHATLRRRGGTYELQAVGGHPVWVNADRVDQLVLASGDIIELGGDAAVLRFRVYPAGTRPSRSVRALFSDCIECAVRGANTWGARARIASRQLPRDLATRSSRLFRVAVVAVVLAAAGSTWGLVRRTDDLESRLAALTQGIEIAPLLDRSEGPDLDSEVFRELLDDLEDELTTTSRRLDSLRGQLASAPDVVRRASRATIFLQGAFGFRDPVSGQELKLVLGPNGVPLRSPSGEPHLALGGAGPPLESQYTGTGWVASADGLVVTNRHVALPWEFDATAQTLIARGFEPVMRRFIGYLPGEPAPFEVSLVAASERGDLAVLCCSVTAAVPFLELADGDGAAGAGVIVLGYPLGIRALVARAGPEFVSEVRGREDADFWTVADLLADRGLITPLATQGMVGQVTERYVVYDAATTSGGSGGPVLGLDGRVVAVSSAVLHEFGGSNLGVPAALVRALLDGLESGDPH